MNDLIEYNSHEAAIEAAAAREEFYEQIHEATIDAIVEGQINAFGRGHDFGENYEKGNFEQFAGDFWRGFLEGAKQVKEDLEQKTTQPKQEKKKEETRSSSNEDDLNILLALGVFILQVATVIKLSVL